MLAEAADANSIYEEALENLKYRKPPSSKSIVANSVEKEQAAKDYYANVRTNVCSCTQRSYTPPDFVRLGPVDMGTFECKFVDIEPYMTI